MAQIPGNAAGYVDAHATAPTIAAGAALGTGPTVALSTGANDLAGTCTLTTGTGPVAGVAATITFGEAYASAPRAVVISRADAVDTAAPNVSVGTIAAGSFIIRFGVAGAASTAYKVTYTVVP